MAEFLDMGGDAATVWPAYGVTIAVLTGLLVASLRTYARRRRDLERLERTGRDNR